MSAKIESQQPASSNQPSDSYPALSLSFSKSLRLLESGDFQRVFDDAPFRASHQHFLILARTNELDHPRLGLVIAKKHLRLAVERNRFKRLIRESFRTHQHTFSGIDVIVLSRKGLENLDNGTFTQQLNQQWQRILKKARQHGLRSQPQVAAQTHHSVNGNAQTPDH
ncbi:ribonuclease P protein component [Cellvibrio mixtus]|uniref:ribonuclease P protein component n=1 Tax=Cellvibrio mixtus TaxID=39650 RepID=UPI000586B217|nr:ribonuclease P protein component [Cellvibrio mixtus]